MLIWITEEGECRPSGIMSTWYVVSLFDPQQGGGHWPFSCNHMSNDDIIFDKNILSDFYAHDNNTNDY